MTPETRVFFYFAGFKLIMNVKWLEFLSYMAVETESQRIGHRHPSQEIATGLSSRLTGYATPRTL